MGLLAWCSGEVCVAVPSAVRKARVRSCSSIRCSGQHDLWPVEDVKDFGLLSARVDATGSLISLDWIAVVADPTASGGFRAPRPRRVRPRRTLSVTYANGDRSRLAAASPPSRELLAHTWRGCPVLCAGLQPIRHGASLDPLSPVEIISTFAGRLPPSSERPIRPKVLVSPSLISKRPSRPPARGHVVSAVDANHPAASGSGVRKIDI